MTSPDKTGGRSPHSSDDLLLESAKESPKEAPKKQVTLSRTPESTAEWVSLGISSAILAIVIALVGYLWMGDRHRLPPILNVTTAEVRHSRDQFYVPFTVVNAGGGTAESVQVVAELQIGGVTVESGEQIIDFLSREEQVEGAFIFTQDPREGVLMIRVASYKKP